MKYRTRSHIAHSTLVEKMRSFFSYSTTDAEKELIKLQCAVNPAQIELRSKNPGIKDHFIVSVCTSHEECYHIAHTKEPAGGLVIGYGSDMSCIDFLLEFKNFSNGDFTDRRYTHSLDFRILAEVLCHYCDLSGHLLSALMKNICSGQGVRCQIGEHLNLYVTPYELLEHIVEQGVSLERLLVQKKDHTTPFLTMRLERAKTMDNLEFSLHAEKLKKHLDTIY